VSDGDVLLHALVDAILGALGRGDIGEHFPPDRTAPGQDSRLFLRHALRLLEEEGARVVNADCIVYLERPSLREWKRPIKDSLAELLRTAPERVGVKAKTSEGLGPVGEGLAVAAQAAALIETRG
jgi:2-C-methyl-D-erythritol 2,4-cyclodiphosphate synthase